MKALFVVVSPELAETVAGLWHEWVAKDRRPEHRKLLLELLARCGAAISVQTLIHAATHYADRQPEADAANGLSAIRSPEALEALIGVLDNTDEKIRSKALYSVRRIDAERALAHILRMADDSNASVRMQVYETFGSNLPHVESQQIARELIDLLRTGSTKVKIVTLKALAHTSPKLVDKIGLAAVRQSAEEGEDIEERKNAIDALANLGGISEAETLFHLLEMAPNDLKLPIWEALALAGDRRVVPSVFHEGQQLSRELVRRLIAPKYLCALREVGEIGIAFLRRLCLDFNFRITPSGRVRLDDGRLVSCQEAEMWLTMRDNATDISTGYG